MKDSTPDRELLRLHRRACTDFAARMRLPAWEHLPMPLTPPMSEFTVGDLLCRVVNGNLAAAAELAGLLQHADARHAVPRRAHRGNWTRARRRLRAEPGRISALVWQGRSARVRARSR